MPPKTKTKYVNGKLPYNAWVAMTPRERIMKKLTEPFDGWDARAERQNKVWSEIEDAPPDMTLRGDQVTGSAFQNEAERKSKEMFAETARKAKVNQRYYEAASQGYSPEELAQMGYVFEK